MYNYAVPSGGMVPISVPRGLGASTLLVRVRQKLTAAGKSGSGADEVDAQTGLHTKLHISSQQISAPAAVSF
jgi:hypothetical protein